MGSVTITWPAEFDAKMQAVAASLGVATPGAAMAAQLAQVVSAYDAQRAADTQAQQTTQAIETRVTVTDGTAEARPVGEALRERPDEP